MIPAHLLQPGELYYTHDDTTVWVRHYIGSKLSSRHEQPVYYFCDQHDRPYRVWPSELLAYYATEGEALAALLERIDRARAGVVGLIEQKS